MSQVVSLRLPDQTADRLRALARRSGRSLNELGATSIEEWIRTQEFAEIEFRSLNGPLGGERHACVKGHLPVWRVIQLASTYEMDAGATARHLNWPTARVQAAISYYRVFPEEIDRVLEDARSQGLEQLQALLPQTEVFSISPE